MRRTLWLVGGLLLLVGCQDLVVTAVKPAPTQVLEVDDTGFPDVQVHLRCFTDAARMRSDLTDEDFTIVEGDQLRPVVSAKIGTRPDAKRRFVIVADNGLGGAFNSNVAGAAERFVQSLRPTDEVAVVVQEPRTSKTPTRVASPFTGGAAGALRALQSAETGQRRLGLAIASAIRLAGRRPDGSDRPRTLNAAVVVLTARDYRGGGAVMQEEMDSIAAALKEGWVPVYLIGVQTTGWPGFSTESLLAKIVDSTGGLLLNHASDAQCRQRIFAEMDTMYTLKYRSAFEGAPGESVALKVTADGREGQWRFSPNAALVEACLDELLRARLVRILRDVKPSADLALALSDEIRTSHRMAMASLGRADGDAARTTLAGVRASVAKLQSAIDDVLKIKIDPRTAELLQRLPDGPASGPLAREVNELMAATIDCEPQIRELLGDGPVNLGRLDTYALALSQGAQFRRGDCLAYIQSGLPGANSAAVYNLVINYHKTLSASLEAAGRITGDGGTIEIWTEFIDAATAAHCNGPIGTAYAERARLNGLAGRAREAAEDYDRVMELGGASPDAGSAVIAALLSAGRIDRAFTIAEAMVPQIGANLAPLVQPLSTYVSDPMTPTAAVLTVYAALLDSQTLRPVEKQLPRLPLARAQFIAHNTAEARAVYESMPLASLALVDKVNYACCRLGDRTKADGEVVKNLLEDPVFSWVYTMPSEPDEAEVVRSLYALGRALYLVENRAAAQTVFRRIREINPGYRVDPFYNE